MFKKYAYYIVYCGYDSHGQFIKGSYIEKESEISTWEDIQDIVELFEKQQECESVVILNWKRLGGLKNGK